MAKPLHSDFIEEDDEEASPQKEDKWSPPEMTEIATQPVAGKDRGQPVEVEVTDDTPEGDRGRWVADDKRDGEPDVPGDEEIRGYAKGAQKRIQHMTARIHAERRRADEIAREQQEAINLARRLMQENNALKDFVHKGEQVLMGEHRGRLQSLVDSAKVAYKEAHDAGDANGMIAAQEQLASAIAKMERAAAQPRMNLPKEDESIFNRAAQGQPQQHQPDPDAVKWAEKNKWFGRDDAMTGYALGFHKQLVERDGVSPDQPEYYTRLNQEMRKRFPDRFRGQGNGAMPERRTASPVAGVSRTGNAAPRRVQITESQARLAKRLGLTVEQYAQQIVAEQDQRDGRTFTHS
jgi:hypothetical protein